MINLINEAASRNIRPLAALVAIQLAVAVVMCLPPFYLQRVVSAVINYQSSEFPTTAIVVLVGLMAITALLSGLNGYLAAWFSSDLLRNLQTRFFQHLQALPIDYLRKQSTGEFFARFNSDVGQFQQLIASILPQLTKEITICVLVVIFMLLSFPIYLVLALIGICAIYLALGALLQKKLSEFAVKQRSSWGEINRQFDEVAVGAETIRTFNAEEATLHEFERETSRFRQLALKAGKLSSTLSPLIELASRLGGLLVSVLAIFLVFNEAVSIDQFVLFFFFAALLQGSIGALVNQILGMPPLLEGTRRLNEFFEAGNQDHDQGSRIIDLSEGVSVQFDDVHFSYAGGHELYNGLSFTMEPRSVTHLTGRNGSGKTTLVNLLLGFHVPGQGQIRINGADLEDLDKRALRKNISVVSQQQHIFNESLKNNLNLANPEATDSECLEALSQVGLSDWVQGLPRGLETILDPAGKNMSGGEKQKIGIARILLRKSALVIFDEPWSNLDIESRSSFSDLLPEISANSTVLIIAHSERLDPGVRKIRLDDPSIKTKVVPGRSNPGGNFAETPGANEILNGLNA